MKASIESQLGAYLNDVTNSQQPITVAELQMLTVAAGGKPPRLSRGPVVGIASAVAVLILVGLVPLLTSDEPSLPANTTPVTTVPPATSAPTTITGQRQPGVPVETVEALTWERLPAVEIGPRFALPEGTALFDGGDVMIALRSSPEGIAIATSVDGVEWKSGDISGPEEFTRVWGAWEGQLLVTAGGGGWGYSADGPGWASPSVVQVLRSDGSWSRTVFDGEISEAAIGAAGILITLTPNQYGDSYGDIIDEVLGSTFTSVSYEVEFVDGVIEVTTIDGRFAEIVLADHGYDQNARDAKPTEFLSPNGEDWEPLTGTPTAEIAGTGDGFIAIEGRTVWHSPDGRAWTDVGALDFTHDHGFWVTPHEVPVHWQEGVVVGNQDGRLAHASSSGVFALTHPVATDEFDVDGQMPLLMAGDLGLVIVDTVQSEIHVTSNGEDWTSLGIPEEITYQPSWYRSSGAVTAEGIVLWLWQGATDESIWWLARSSDPRN